MFQEVNEVKRELPGCNVCSNNSACSLQHLQRIVLAINFNNPHFTSIPALKHFYTPIFGKVIFCSPKGNKEFNVIGVGGLKGWLGYNCLTQAAKMYPNYEGYLYGNDDLIINWWNLYQYDISKIWFPFVVHKIKLQEVGRPTDKWFWWKKTDGLNKFRNSLR